jgi:DNA-binding beta-propeller fold protein YncE
VLVGLLVLAFGKRSDAALRFQSPNLPDFLPYYCVRGYHSNSGFENPTSLSFGGRKGGVYVADTGSAAVDAFNFQGVPASQYGTKNGLHAPFGVAVDSHGNIFVSEADGGPIKIIDSKGNITTLDIPAVPSDREPKPGRLIFDYDGNLYVVERANCRILVFDKHLDLKMTIGGLGNKQGQFKMLQDVAVDRQGRIYALDSMLPVPVQVFDRGGNFIYRFGTLGEADQDLSLPSALFVDRNDQVWIVDKTAHALKVFNRAGIFLRKFGTYGPGVGQLFYPIDGAIDDLGRVYVLESGARRFQVFKLNQPFTQF